MIFHVESAREIIEIEIKNRQAMNPSYSATAFAKKIGVSQAYLSLILKGERSVTVEVAEKLAQKLHYSEVQRQYLLLLAQKDRVSDASSRKALHQALVKVKNEHLPNSHHLKFFDVISEWYFSAILEAVQIMDFPATESTLAKRLNLPIGKIRKALRTLEDLSLVKKKGGAWSRARSDFLQTSTEVQSAALKKFHRQILALASSAIESQPIEHRSFTGITMAIDPAKIPEAKLKILNFQRELMGFLESGERKEVYQLEIQLFQLKEKERDGE